MPLEPIRFKTIEDVTRLLHELQKQELITFSKTDTAITVTPEQMQKLKRELIVGSDFQTYRLSEALNAQAGDSYHSLLTFITKKDNDCLSPVTIPLSAKERLEDPSNLLLSNIPLINALIKLNPNAVDLFIVQPLCQFSDKPIIFPVLTPRGETFEGVVGVNQIFSVNNKNASQTGYTLTARSFIPNYALHDLLMINQRELQRFLSTLPIDVMNEKLASMQDNLTRVKKLLSEFGEQHPANKGSVIEERRLYREDDTQLLQRMVSYRQSINSWKEEKMKAYSGTTKIVKGGDIIQHQTQAVSNRTRSVIILAASSELLVTLPFLFYKSGRLVQEKKKLKTYVSDQERAVEPFMRNELTKAYALVINPSLEVVQFCEQMLQQIVPRVSEMVDPVVSPNRLGNSLFVLMPPPPPAPPALEGNQITHRFGK